MNGLDLFSGIGGLAEALRPWVMPVAYCEINHYAQRILISRMECGDIQPAPIWDDVGTLRALALPKMVDIIYGGFPCQDLSVAGLGKGLAGERSGLFFEIMRLAEEIKPKFIFLENVPAIRTRGLNYVGDCLASAGYDCRWDFISAEEIGAHHKRQRWFLLAHANSDRCEPSLSIQARNKRKGLQLRRNGEIQPLANAAGIRGEPRARWWEEQETESENFKPNDWWATEPSVGRVANGIPFRVDRLKCLGNSVVPAQAREAFKRLLW